MRIDAVETWAPGTGAIRLVTPDLLREIYLAPMAQPLDLGRALHGFAAPWAASHAAAPAETEAALCRALRAVALGSDSLTPDALRPEALDAGRARDHLAGLRSLWDRVDGALPDDLTALRHVLSMNASDALEPLPIASPPCRWSLPGERAVESQLIAHHGHAPDDILSTRRPSGPAAPPHTALRQIQVSLGGELPPLAPDSSTATWGLRDPIEEAEFAAALVQNMLDAGTINRASEVGILTPGGLYPDLLATAFDAVGLALSGNSPPMPGDAAAELLGNVLRLLESPGARMALASVLTSPLMPWSADRGGALARRLMDRGSLRPDAETAPILEQLQSPVTTTAQVFARLDALACALPPEPQRAVQAKIAELRPVMTGALPDWRAATRTFTGSPKTVRPDRFVEGVSLFDADSLPWRGCRHLIVLGLAGDAWPQPVAADPMFLDREKLLIREKTGLHLPTRGEELARRLELFRRQLSVAGDGVDLLVPALDAAGNRLAPSMGLALIARAFGESRPEALVRDVRNLSTGVLPVQTRRPPSVPLGGRPELPIRGEVTVGTDLLRLRRDDMGRALPQSPSRVETLIVSPLAFTLQELDAHPVVWIPETLDVLTLGTIAHDVLESAFPAALPLPSAEVLEQALDEILASAIRRNAAWLGAAGWEAERSSLRREIGNICQAWLRRLAGLGAQVLANEFPLAGDGHGLVLSGRVDCLLRLADDRLVVVDHKRSSSSKRERRMSAGWDLQVELYRAMLARPTVELPIPVGEPVAVAYHTMLDGRLLSHGLPGVSGVDELDSDISGHAVAELQRLIGRLSAGHLPLGTMRDDVLFPKERGITAYALEEPFIRDFLAPAPEIEDEEEEP